MDAPRLIASGVAIGRIAIGAALAVAPEAAAARWIGADADRVPVQVALRGLGTRDVVLGAGTLAALGDRDAARAWLAGGILADGADLAGTAIAGAAIPRGGRIGVLVLAGGAIVAGAWVLATLD